MRRLIVIACIAGLVSGASAAPALAVVQSYPVTFGPDGDEWVFQGDLSGPFGSTTALGVRDTPVGMLSGASLVLVNGTPFVPPGLDVTGTTRATAVQRIGKLSVVVKIHAYDDADNAADTLAFLYTIKNVSSRKQSLNLKWGSRRSGGANVDVLTTTDGDTFLGPNEPWMETVDNAFQPYGITFALGTRGTSATAVSDGDAIRMFTTTILPRRAKTFGFFVAIDPQADHAESAGHTFDNKAALLQAGHLESNIPLANW